jgi:hypothetical protein
MFPKFSNSVLTQPYEFSGCAILLVRKALPRFFLCIFSSLTCLKKRVFSKRDLLRWKVFLKSEKIPALLYLGKGPEYKPFHDFQPVPSAYRPWAQISNHGRAVLRPFSYTFFFFFFNEKAFEQEWEKEERVLRAQMFSAMVETIRH